ncbi:MAG: hypothetical protein DWQ07_16900 [Chloroflexi bacterium]|nr:MAG: hypothetical protein DWQ07_16900 [Chloroflexota bacterium]MBL1195083.1 hypothetical protein [Chloroflexota bacterium]NOH12370.1 hypothetical protein [Chloroflexota bacterium]
MNRILPVLWLLPIIGIAACQSALIMSEPDGIRETPVPLQDHTGILEEIHSECFISVDIEIWEDANANGIREGGERPISGVEVGFYRSYNPSIPEITDTSQAGHAMLDFIIGREDDCDLAGHEVKIIELPPGYLAPVIDIDLGDVDNESQGVQISFGLIPDSSEGPNLEEELQAGECFRSILVEVWEDSNGNGLWDQEEVPVEDISIGLLPPGYRLSELTGEDLASTSAQGKANFGFFVLGDGCDLTGYRLLLLATPAGFWSPDNQVVDLGEIDTGAETLRFAFALIPD